MYTLQVDVQLAQCAFAVFRGGVQPLYQHTSAYVSIRQHTSACVVNIRQHT
jgi:hypothetical protein